MPVHPFFELHAGLPQQGPGSDASTARAFEAIRRDLPPAPRILDFGCGTGRQTLALARLAPDATLEAVDVLLPFVEELERRAAAAGLDDRVTARKASMLDPRFKIAPAHLIWSEGAIYNVGLRTGLEAWREFLLPGGFVALTEWSWLTDAPPDEPLRYWSTAYPAAQTTQANLALIEALGWRVLDHFTLPESDWDFYYGSQDARHRLLSEKYAGDTQSLAALGEHREEMELYRRYSRSYGYVFYILRVT